MKANEILELVRAGWTKADILALAQGGPDTEPVQDEDISQPADAEPAADTQLEPAPEEKPAWAVSLEKSMAAMIQTLQAANRASSGKGAVETVQTTDDILREMFAEPKKGV